MPTLAVVDTSVWVSAFLNPDGYPARIYHAARTSQFQIVTSTPLLEELTEVLARPRLVKIRATSLQDIRDYVGGIANVATLVDATGTLTMCRDPDDNILLETAIVGHATHVISRDEDLTRDLTLQQHLKSNGVRLVTVNQFLNELTGG